MVSMPFSLKNYSSLKKIADGGMGQLFTATELSNNRLVAIKKLTLPSENRLNLLRRFENEVSNTSSLIHNNIINIIDYGNDDDNFYIVMEYIDGCDFNKIISDISFDRNIGLLIVFKALQALNFAHAKGIIHSDFKPANILIDKNGRVVLSDFGLSRRNDYNQDLCNFTTPLFMPPEQAFLVSEQSDLDSTKWLETVSVLYTDPTREQVSAIIDQGIKWDIWSAGVLLYYVCTGSYPFQENDFAGLMKSIMYSDPIINLENVPGLPYSVASMIQKCLQKEPYKRPKSLDDVIRILEKYIAFLKISDINGKINNYFKENSGLFSKTITSDPVIIKKQSNPSDPIKTTNTTSEFQYNDFLKTVTQDKPVKTQSQPIEKKSSSNVIRSEISVTKGKSQTKQSEKSLQPQKPGIESGFELALKEKTSTLSTASQKLEESDSFGLRIQERVSTYVRQWFSQFSNIRLRLTHIITVITLLILCATGLFVFKQHAGKQNVSDSGVSAIAENNSNVHEKSETTTPEKIVDQKTDTVKTLLKQDTVSSTPDSEIKSKSVSSHIESQNSSLPIKNTGMIVKNKDAANQAKLLGMLKVSIDPTNAQVYLDGSLLSSDDITNGKNVNPGKYTVYANADGYSTYSQYITIEPNKTFVLGITLKQDVKGNGQLHVYSYPWANLYIDDELKGTTPTPSPVLLSEGEHNVLLKRDGFQPYNEVVTIHNGETVRLKVQLKKTGE